MKNFLFFAVFALLFAGTCAAQNTSGVSLKSGVKIEMHNLNTGVSEEFLSTVDEISKNPPEVFSINGTGYSERGFFWTDKSHPFVMVSRELDFIRLFPDGNSLPWLSGEEITVKETKKKIIFSGNLRNADEIMFVKVIIYKK